MATKPKIRRYTIEKVPDAFIDWDLTSFLPIKPKYYTVLGTEVIQISRNLFNITYVLEKLQNLKSYAN